MGSAQMAFAIVLVCGVANCSDATAASSVARIVIEPETLVLQANESCVLHANLFDGSGGAITGPKLTWTTSASGILSITKGGKVAGVSTGTATVTATLNGHTDTLAVNVIPRIFSSSIQVPARTIALGATDQLSLVLYDVNDNPVNATVPTEWAVDDSSKATVSATGLLTARAVGVVIVSARWATGGSLAVNNAGTAVYIVAQAP
jgi:uncharacterized protein YjdB